ncbi:nucleoside/nucleotide kinase family protein [Deinococcus arenicola]|uniref:Nucleoside/nucleotide kinase family protein n=1 Tax=Deinococcus arenicola TaxID=2994950 RepID=A0ABU4DRD2_9DEIO|nr:nucleoside/nucleotide kinase family protein [Deinococcus sp. ZS9-10]MDV6374993.1 nucleoside/nucleotide kinase family protein [Deinococcus sp. ZS9-10]
MIAPQPDSPLQPALPESIQATLEELVERARGLLISGEMGPGQRRILGIVGAPGAGKSTLCTALVTSLGDQAVLVGMDGFHLANAELERLGRRDRKGAPDTFDAGGYAALLARLRSRKDQLVYAPTFDRQLEESIGSAIAIPAGPPLIITEGNYLLLRDGDWAQVRPQLDETWFLDLPERVRLDRLTARHVAFGKAPAEAEGWVAAVDGPNADIINATRAHADLIVQLVD